MKTLEYQLVNSDDTTQMGLIVLQSDVTIEDEFREYFSAQPVSLLANRIPFENEVTSESLKQMESHIASTVSLFPVNAKFDSLAYACTSGAQHIGSDRIKELVGLQRSCDQVTDPMKAAITAMRHIGAKRISFLAPYSQTVTQSMILEIEDNGFVVAESATFNESQDINVGRISPESIYQAAVSLCKQQAVDALFIACTNMKCANVIPKIEAETGIYVLSSNLALAWDMARLAGHPLRLEKMGRLCR